MFSTVTIKIDAIYVVVISTIRSVNSDTKVWPACQNVCFTPWSYQVTMHAMLGGGVCCATHHSLFFQLLLLVAYVTTVILT